MANGREADVFSQNLPLLPGTEIQTETLLIDGELAVAGASLVAGKSAARAFRHGLGGALAAAEVCLRLIEAEPRT